MGKKGTRKDPEPGRWASPGDIYVTQENIRDPNAKMHMWNVLDEVTMVLSPRPVGAIGPTELTFPHRGSWAHHMGLRLRACLTTTPEHHHELPISGSVMSREAPGMPILLVWGPHSEYQPSTPASVCPSPRHPRGCCGRCGHPVPGGSNSGLRNQL